MVVAEVQYIGPAQLLMKVRMPTAATLNPAMPLYALDKSTEEIALEPPAAKKVAYWNITDEVVISAIAMRLASIRLYTTCERRKIGTLAARDCVIARMVSSSCSSRA